MPSFWIDLPVRHIPSVSVYSLLPPAGQQGGQIYGVIMDEGANPSGMYYSDGITWILVTDAGGTAAVTNGLNLGAGAQVFKDKVGQDLRFRTLVGNNMSVVEGVDTIVLTPLFANSASPGFTFGKDGPLGVGDWLLQENVPSNKAGRPLQLDNPKITTIGVRLGVTDTCTLGIYEHDSVTYTLKYTITITASRSVNTTGLAVVLTQDKEVGIKIASGSVSNGVTVALTLSGGTS